MQPDTSAFQDKIRRIREALEAKQGEIATQLSLSVKALANRNAVEYGIGASYSNNDVPVFYFDQSTINQGGKEYIKKQKKSKRNGGNNGLGNWKGLRAAEGLQVNHVDLTHSGQMWRGIVPLPPMKQGNVVVAPLGGTTLEVQKEMNYNYERFGDFILKSLTPENQETLRIFVNDEIKKIINEVI